jgi:dTDP-4-amino-4,6-dideoxygalactose transaminase
VTVVAADSERTDAETAQWHVPLADVLVDTEIEEAVAEVVRSGWWSMGPRVAEFEREFATFCGTEHALAVANGTAALHLALLALGCGPGDEVILPSLSFVAAANSTVNVGATPVFCDVSGPGDLNLDPDDLEAAVTPATKAIVVMHYGGHPCRMEAILDVAVRHDLVIVEDAAHGLGATWQGRMCGGIGDIGCFSFFANKNLSTAEGGMVVTNDPHLADRVRLLRSHGMTTPTWDRHRGHAHSYDVVAHGFNYRLDELRAAIGLVELRRLSERNRARARIVERYRAELDGIPGLCIPFDDDRFAAHHLAVLVLPEDCPRNGFRAGLAAKGIQTSVHYPPTHRFECYRATGRRRPLPVTEAVADRLVTLPLYPHMQDDDIAAVTGVVRALLQQRSTPPAAKPIPQNGGTPWN